MFWIIAGSIIAALFLVLLSLFIWGMVNRGDFIKTRENCQKTFATIKMFYKKRYEVICKIIEDFAKDDKKTKMVNSISKAANELDAAAIEDDKLKCETNLSDAIEKFLNKIKKEDETNPDIIQLRKFEDEILSAKKYYNACAKRYNFMRESFPSTLIAKWNDFKKLELLD